MPLPQPTQAGGEAGQKLQASELHSQHSTTTSRCSAHKQRTQAATRNAQTLVHPHHPQHIDCCQQQLSQPCCYFEHNVQLLHCAGGITSEEPQRKRRAPWNGDVAETGKALGGLPEVDMDSEGLGAPLVDPAEALAAYSARTSVSEHMMDSVLKVVACLC